MSLFDDKTTTYNLDILFGSTTDVKHDLGVESNANNKTSSASPEDTECRYKATCAPMSVLEPQIVWFPFKPCFHSWFEEHKRTEPPIAPLD